MSIVGTNKAGKSRAHRAGASCVFIPQHCDLNLLALKSGSIALPGAIKARILQIRGLHHIFGSKLFDMKSRLIHL